MISSCIFCQIIRGQREAFIVYETENVVAFLDKYPVYEGHTLIVPKEHYKDIFETPDVILGEMISVAKKLSIALRVSLKASGVRIVMNNGRSAGQEIMHVHIHVIPYGVNYTGRRELTLEEGEKVSKMIKDALQQV